MLGLGSLALLLPVLLGCSHPVPGKKSFHKLLLISFDGFRWDYDQDVDTPNMDSLAKDRFQGTVFHEVAFKLSAGLPSSGGSSRWIEDHGVIHNMMFNTETLWKHTYKATQNKSEWWDKRVLPLWITAQRQGRKTASFHYPGGGAKYKGEAVQSSLVESYTHPDSNETEWRENIDIVMDWFTKEDFDFVTLYHGEPDKVGHRVGPETENRRVIIRQIDRTIRYLVDAIKRHGLANHLNIIITSDHGMTTVKKQPNVTEILLSNYISFRNLVKFDIEDYGSFGMILPKPGQEEAIYQALKNAHPHLNVYKKEEFPERFHFAKHERVLPIVIYGDSGYNINGRFIIYFNKGDHGFDNANMDMKTIFRAFGPDFKKNHLAEPFDSIHIYPLMCKLLGLTPEPHNGSLAVTQEMLLDSSDQQSRPSRRFRRIENDHAAPWPDPTPRESLATPPTSPIAPPRAPSQTPSPRPEQHPSGPVGPPPSPAKSPLTPRYRLPGPASRIPAPSTASQSSRITSAPP
ncbi:ectonucleotide pyrophosphatase/phosphodiesterase family member 7-like [Choloepus didactylus]|uniref:ectonucleotide pyrophosphatase/phosphodiesterase family member 7-like n=1 Tax=Choloepus didactylus TaxID=27675 RepID=UPI00189E4565|nr:ectonucleotide pyrophosphatase/phosphodiesterase family member 7-like [Choloepus didactylus]